MRKRSLIIPLIAVLGLGTVGATIAITSGVSTVETKADEGIFTPSGSLPESYKLNDRFVAPSGTISYEGERLPVEESFLIFPDGKTFKKGNYVLDVAGQYDCTFLAKKGNKTIYAHYKFKALSGVYSVGDSSSSVRFDSQLPTTNAEASGLTVDLAENDMFTFNQVVDLSKSDSSTPIIKYYPHAMTIRANPENEGKNLSKVWDFDDPEKPRCKAIDCGMSVVRITDAYDSSNYIETYIFYRTANTANNRQQQYAVGGASCQSKIGLEINTTGKKGSGSKITKIDGVDYTVFIGNGGFGTTMDTRSGQIFENRPDASGKVTKRCIGTTLDANTTADISNADDFGYSVYYEAESKKLYLQHAGRHFLNDLDEPALYADNEQFKGFTTGEVYVSLYGMEYNDLSAKFSIESIGGFSGEELNAPAAVDTKAPDIELSSELDDFNISVNEKFPLFDAKVTDVNYAGDLNVAAYYEYGNAQQAQVPVVDNAFVPTKPGTYSVIYTAKDTYGNVGVKTLTLHAVTTPHDQIVDFSVGKIGDVEAGKTVILPEHTAVSYNDSLRLKCVATYEDGTETEINTNTREFFVGRVGEYTLTYTYGDGLFSYEYSYKFNSLASKNVYLEKLSLPRYLIKGASYTLDEAMVVKCESKNIDVVEPDVFAIEDGGSEKKIDRRDYAVEASTSVKFVYKYGSTQVFESEEIKVVDVNFRTELVRSSYFVNYGTEVSSTDSSIVLSAESGTVEAHADFANATSFLDFSMEFDFATAPLDAESFDIVMSDYEDENNTFVISFFTEFGIRKVDIGGKAVFSTSDNYSLTYNPLSGYMYDSSDSKVYLDNPFPSGRMNLSFYFREVSSNSGVAIKAIGAQRLSNSSYDDCQPTIIGQRVDGLHQMGEEITVDFIYPDDTFSPYLEKNYTLNVTYYQNPESEPTYVTSTNGILLDGSENINSSYSFKAEKIGSYEVNYRYTDQAYVQGSLDYAFTANDIKIVDIADNVPPTITLDQGYGISTVISASLNSEHKIQSYKVSDNSGKASVKVYVMDPTMKTTLLEGDKVRLDKKGLWTVSYYAYDENGNASSVYYRILVA
ncbi:MAG: hypothetical protein MJ239_04155 [Bacilli bacterium]|nr:hypothetical protein [Bacilli bacterium]